MVECLSSKHEALDWSYKLGIVVRTNTLRTWEVEKEEQKANVISRYLESSRLTWERKD